MEETIKDWKKEENLENLRYIWDYTYCTIEDTVVKVKSG